MLNSIQEIQRKALEVLSDGVHPFTLKSINISFDESASHIAEVTAHNGKGNVVKVDVFADGQTEITEVPF